MRLTRWGCRWGWHSRRFACGLPGSLLCASLPGFDIDLSDESFLDVSPLPGVKLRLSILRSTRGCGRKAVLETMALPTSTLLSVAPRSAPVKKNIKRIDKPAVRCRSRRMRFRLCSVPSGCVRVHSMKGATEVLDLAGFIHTLDFNQDP